MASGSGAMDWEAIKSTIGKKRSIEIDPDSGEQLQESKRPKIILDSSKKSKCLRLILGGFEKILNYYFPVEMIEGKPVYTNRNIAYATLQVSSQIANIIFTLHTYNRQIAAGKTSSNVITKSSGTDFTISHLGVAISKPRSRLLEIWDNEVKSQGLEYKVFARSDDTNNWYGTFGPYIDFFCGFGLRMKELRLGHDKMPTGKRDGIVLEVPIKKYGLNGAHHILMEGSTFPPEKRSSMAQSVGPMTALLSMVRSEGMYRAKWAAAVKRAFNHIPVIDDVIEITKTVKRASDLSTMIGLLAEITLITTSRQATRAFFPLAFLHAAVMEHDTDEKKAQVIDFFNTTGSGAFYVYKVACGFRWILEGMMTEEAAGQIVFHSIFGTYKEDLSILAEITNVGNWKTREELGKSFVKQASKFVTVKMPVMKYYSKLSCANMSGLLSGVYNQVSAMPTFSGASMRFYGDEFFEHIEKRVTVGSTGKSLNQITASLSITLDEVRKKLRENKGTLQMGTTVWRNMSDLEIGKAGSDAAIVPVGRGKYFMGRSDVK